MDLSKIKRPYGSQKKRKRRGRGSGSGHGKTSCKGHKGANARSGHTTHIAFEGGQMPLIRRVPKRGFRRGDDKLVYQIVNVQDLNAFDTDSVIDKQTLKKNGYIKFTDRPVKVLGQGDIKRAVTVKVDAFSNSAVKKLEQAGGKAQSVSSNS